MKYKFFSYLFSPSLRTTMTMLALTTLVHRSEAEMRRGFSRRGNLARTRVKEKNRLSFPTAFGGDYHVATLSSLLVMTEKRFDVGSNT